MVKIEEGKFYKTRDGQKVGPVRKQDGYLTTNGWHYAKDGECCYRGISGDDKQPEFDIISEWQEGPIREVRRREIVEGQWGIVRVDVFRDQKVITISPENGHNPTATELREAAHLFNQLAEFLDEEQP